MRLKGLPVGNASLIHVRQRVCGFKRYNVRIELKLSGLRFESDTFKVTVNVRYIYEIYSVTALKTE